VSLTHSGNALLQEARQILARVDQAILATRRAGRGEVGQLAVGFISIADYNVLPLMLREFRQAYPLVDLTLKESTTDAQVEDLLNGRIDIGLVLPPIAEPALESALVLSEPLIAALPRQHPLAGKKEPLSLASLAEDAFILFPRHMAPGLHDDVVSFCRDAGFSPRIGQEAIQMQTIISLVSAELGVALIPASLRNLQRTGVVYKTLRESSPMTEIHLAWRRGDSLPVLRSFLDLARKAAGSQWNAHAKRRRR
jgi:DNA-binding transcriptional LysR family regulator